MMRPSGCRRTTGRNVQVSLLPTIPAELPYRGIACLLSGSSCRFLQQMENSDSDLRRPSLCSMPETDSSHQIAERESTCLGGTDGNADTGIMIRSRVKSAFSPAPDCCGSFKTGTSSSRRNGSAPYTLAFFRSGVYIGMSGSAASSLTFVPLGLLCCFIAAVAAAARLDAKQPAFPVSVPVVWSSASHVPFVLHQYVSSSASAAQRGAAMPHAPSTPGKPIDLEEDSYFAADPSHDYNAQDGFSDTFCEQADKCRKSEMAPPPPVLSSDGDNSSETSGPILFVAGLLLSVTGTLISALGDICIRYSFICHKASSADSANTSAAEAVCSEEGPGAAPTGVRSPVEAACECGGNYYDIVSCQPSVEHLNPVTATATSSPLCSQGTGCMSAFQQQYDVLQLQRGVRQVQSSAALRMQQSNPSASTSKDAKCVPALSQSRSSTLLSSPVNTKQVVVPLDAGATRKAAAGTASASLVHNSSLSQVSTRSSFLDCVSAADGVEVNAGISDDGWSSTVAAFERVSGKGTGTMAASNLRTSPAKACQGIRRYQALNEQNQRATAPRMRSGAPSAEHRMTVRRASASILRSPAALGETRTLSCGRCRWNKYWVLGISCTCIVSPVLSIISLSLLPANVTGFAALQIFFVVLLARYILGEVVHRINLGGGVLVIAGLVTLTWSTESKPTMPDRAELYRQLISPSAVVFEVCCGCIVLSGLLLLFLTSYMEQETRRNTTLEASARATVDEELIIEATSSLKREVDYAVPLSQQRSQKEQQRNVGSGGIVPRDEVLNGDELHARLSPGNRDFYKQLTIPSLKESEAESWSTEDIERCRMLKSPHFLLYWTEGERTSARSAATSSTARTAENNAIPSLQGDSVREDNFENMEDISEGNSAFLPLRRHWADWYLYQMFQSRSILLPVAAGVSGSIASICLKLLQAFVISFSAACHNAYTDHSHDASPPTTAVLPSTTSPVAASLNGPSFPAFFTPLAAYLVTSGLWIDFREFPGRFLVASAPHIPSQSAPAAVTGTAALLATAQTAGPEFSSDEAESAFHLLLCLLNPMFLAAHLQLPLLLVAAAAAALVELLFLSHTLKYQPASEGVPLMNAALTLSMGLGGLTLLGAAPRSAVGWGLGLILLIVGVGVLGFGGRTWLAVRRLAVRWFWIRTRSVGSLEPYIYLGSGTSRTEERAGTVCSGGNSDNYRLTCRSDAAENAAAAAAVGRRGLVTLNEDAASVLRTPLHAASAKVAIRQALTVTVAAPPVAAWSSKATCRGSNIDAVGETDGTILAIAASSTSLGHCIRDEKGWDSGPSAVPSHVCEVVDDTDAESRSRRQLLRNPLLMCSEEGMMCACRPGDLGRSENVSAIPGRRDSQFSTHL